MIVYKVTNLLNNKVYIGITTKSLEHRKKVHLRDSKRMNTYFYRAIRKYGEENFMWEIIDYADSIEELHAKEVYYIRLYESFDNKEKGYNTQSGGRNLYRITEEERAARSRRVIGEKNPMYGVPSPLKGKKFTQNHKEKISNALKQAYRPHMYGATNPAARKVRNIDTGEIFGTIKEATLKYPSISRQSICHNCAGRTKRAGKYHWEYVNTEPSLENKTSLKV